MNNGGTQTNEPKNKIIEDYALGFTLADNVYQEKKEESSPAL